MHARSLVASQITAGVPETGGAAAVALKGIERGFNRAFGGAANPLRHLGALGFFLFWIMIATGAFLFIFYDTNVEGAYRSVEDLRLNQPYAGGVIRSLHRYAADAFVLVVVLHLVRELILGRFRGFRWFSWVSGVPLLWLMFASGVVGYWLTWDRLAQFVGVASTEWLDWLPFFGEPLARNFVAPESMGDRLFTLLMFIHISVPLVLLAGMYVHIQRISHADTFPARSLAWGTFAALLVLALSRPAVGQGPADLMTAPQTVALDWFYLFIYPLMYWRSAGEAWGYAIVLTLVLLALPMLSRRRHEPVARVDLANCNGCARCFADCPFEAIVMETRPDSARGRPNAVVLAELCASCGVCVGACPSATPFRSGETLVTGIDLPQQPVNALRAALERELATVDRSARRMVVFGCDQGARVKALAGPDVSAFSLACTAALPPSFVEYALRDGADGVMVVTCGEECDYRLGARWTIERLTRAREPRLRANVPIERLRMVAAGPGQEAWLAHALSDFCAAVNRLPRASAAGLRPVAPRSARRAG